MMLFDKLAPLFDKLAPWFALAGLVGFTALVFSCLSADIDGFWREPDDS